MRHIELSKRPRYRTRTETTTENHEHLLVEYDYPNGVVIVEVSQKVVPGLYRPLWGKEIKPIKP